MIFAVAHNLELVIQTFGHDIVSLRPKEVHPYCLLEAKEVKDLFGIHIHVYRLTLQQAMAASALDIDKRTEA